MKATIKDIARECGVSVSSVSMALSDKPNRISEQTRKKVREAAERMHYQPNMAAVSLVNRKSKMVGIVVNDIRNTHISSLFMAIHKELEKKGYSMICHVLNGEDTSSDELIKLIASENVSALIWAKSLEIDKIEENARLKNDMESLGIPILTMDDYGLTCSGVNVCFDYELGGYLATKHLLDKGHVRIGCLTGDISYQVTQERLCGYKRALEEYRIDFSEELVYHGNYTMEAGYRSLSYLRGQSVTAIFSFNDEMAFGLYQAARNYGIDIPKDISIIGFDNVPFADVMEVPLSTIQVPIVKMGTFMGKEMISLMENEKPAGRKEVLYKPDLLLRGSTSSIMQ